MDAPPSAGSGETEPVRRRRPPDNDTHGISYGTDGVWWCEAHGEDCPMLRYLLAAHPAGPTREEEIATARRFLERNGHAVVDMRNRDASVVPIGVDYRDGGDDQC